MGKKPGFAQRQGDFHSPGNVQSPGSPKWPGMGYGGAGT
jgi:hypothetical protein